METVKKYIDNPLFIKWVYEPDDDINSYWEHYLEKNPGERPLIISLKDELGMVRISNQKLSPERKKLLAAKIVRKIEGRHIRSKIYHIASSSLKYAAVFLFAMGISALLFYSRPYVPGGMKSNTTYTTTVAENGQISKIILPDSSIVWLNSGTSLTYNNNFSISNRDLALSGQAFLEVRKNKKIPLIVSTGDLKVKVHGTRFDVSGYSDENKINVVLESGSVELLHAKNKDFTYMLKPGEMAQYDMKSKSIVINETGLEKYADWKDGVLRFRNTPMDEVIRRLERKFNVEIIVNNPRIYKSVFNANFKNEGLSEIMDYIQFSCPVSYRIQKENESVKSKIILY